MHKLNRPARFFHAAPDEKPGSGNPATLEDRLNQASADLDTAKASIISLTGERDAAQAESAKVKAQFDELTATSEKLKADLESANKTITTITGERDTAAKSLAAASESVSRLEKLCSVKGIDPNAAPPVIPAPAGAKTMPNSEFQKLSFDERNTFIREGGTLV